MTDPLTAIFGGIVISFVSGGIGAYIGGYKKVSIDRCEERRGSCQELLLLKIEELNDKVDKIIEALKQTNISII